MTSERDELSQQLGLAQAAEQRAKQQLLDGKNTEVERMMEELEQVRQEALNNEDKWKERLMEVEKVQCYEVLFKFLFQV